MSAPTTPAPTGSSTLLDLGPVLAFGVVYAVKGVFWATGALMVGVAAAFAVSWRRDRTVRPMTIFTAAIVLVFGSLTLLLNDARFIYLKPTLIAGLSGAVLLVGLAFGRSLLEPLLGTSIPMRPEGWRALSLRFGLFSLGLAAANEIVWRTVTPHAEHLWVWFKLLGVPGLTVAFMVSQQPLMRRWALTPTEPPESSTSAEP